MNRRSTALLLAASCLLARVSPAQSRPDSSAQMDARAKRTTHDKGQFAPDPNYGDPVYDYKAQLDIYGAKHLNPVQRPWIEWGRELYGPGLFSPAPTALGSHNIIIPQLLVYGDFRTAAGQSTNVKDIGRWANRLNLDIDLKITATERIHALFRPFEDKGQFTRFDFTGDTTGFKNHLSGDPTALFFEGDLGAILGGLTKHDAPFDMPIALGRIPLLFANGIWIDDAFTGGAFTIPARNSKSLDWSNFDVTFFYGGHDVSNATVGDGKDHGQIVGMNTFIDAYHGYVEAGYAYVGNAATQGGRDFHSAALSFTRRYGGLVSNSVRYIGAYGVNPASVAGAPLPGGDANGHLFIMENSLITAHEATVVPYLNLFYGIDAPVSAARDPGAGGILKNVGINFETDAITGFPSIDPTGRNAAGGALGLEMLGSNLDHQIVLEAAGTFPTKTSLTMPGSQYAGGVRLQKVLNYALILRADAMVGKRTGLGDIHGVRLELRYKF